MKPPLRILVVDDSPFCRRVTRRALEEQRGFEVVAEAEDGARAVVLTKGLRPDVVVMDVVMPRMNGLDAVTQIMASVPTPVLVLSGDPAVGTGELAYEALRRGAIDLMAKDEVGCSPRGRAQLRDRVRFLATVPVIRHLTPRAARPAPVVSTPLGGASVVVLVASTGGPAALARVLEDLPAGFPATVLVVQHLRPGFVEGLASWLDGVSPLTVRVAQEGEALCPGVVLLAPDHTQMTVTRDRRIALRPPTSGAAAAYCPSGDALLGSAATELGPAAIGLVLTGMGDDGATGLRQLKTAGGATMVQDPDTSAVHGMPRAALRLDGSHPRLPIDAVGRALVRLTSKKVAS